MDESLKQKVEYFLYENDSFKATAAKFLLAFLALGPVLVVGAAVPGLFSAAGKIERSRRYSKKQYQNAYKNLRNRKLLRIDKKEDNKLIIKLTKKGQDKIKKFCFETLEIRKPAKWDRKWRILIFDIPARPKIYNNAREALRHKIKELGFYQMQKSVWVHPYPCEEEILLVAEIFHVKRFIEIITADKLLHGEKIKKVFKL